MKINNIFSNCIEELIREEKFLPFDANDELKTWCLRYTFDYCWAVDNTSYEHSHNDTLKILTTLMAKNRGTKEIVDTMAEYFSSFDRVFSNFYIDSRDRLCNTNAVTIAGNGKDRIFTPEQMKSIPKFGRVRKFVIRNAKLNEIPDWFPEDIAHLSFSFCLVSLHNIHKYVKKLIHFELTSSEITDSILGLLMIPAQNFDFDFDPDMMELRELIKQFKESDKEYDIFGLQNALIEKGGVFKDLAKL